MLNIVRGRLLQAVVAAGLLAASATSVQAAPVASSAETVVAAQQNGTSSATRATSRNNRTQRICVRAETSTGSRLEGRPICRTRAEWEREGGIPTNDN